LHAINCTCNHGLRNVSVTVTEACRWRAGPEGPAHGLAGRGRHTQPACCQQQAQCRLACVLLQPTGNETDGSRGRSP